VMETLNLITGGCGSCLNNQDNYCVHHKKRVEDADPRCDQFSRRYTKAKSEDPRRFYRDAVYDMLGVRGPTLERLAGTG